MTKIIVFFLSIFVATAGIAENFTLNNQSPYPIEMQHSKIALQWATSARDTDENNNRLQQGVKLNPDTLRVLTQHGKINLTLPEKAEYFRVIVWSKGVGEPDFLTNWVNIVPNKTYTLNEDHLVPVTLMSGMGC